MSFGPQKPRRPADVPMEQWIMQQAARAGYLFAAGRKMLAHEILQSLALDVLYEGRPSIGGNPCGEIALLDEVDR